MSDRLLLATRKGLIEVHREGGSTNGASPWRVGRCHFEAESVTIALADPRDGALYAGLRHGHFGVKLQVSRDRGATWNELPAPAYAATSEGSNSGEDNDNGEGGAEAEAKAPSVDMLWCLEPGGDDVHGRLWAGTLPGGLFRSDDHGASWQLVESLWNVPERSEWFGGGYDEPGIHSILVDPRDSDRLVVAVSCGGIWHSDDAGASWRLEGEGLRAEYMPEDMSGSKAIQDPHRLAWCRAEPEVVWCQHHNGIFRSTDGGKTWNELTAIEPRFGFAVAAHPTDPETAFFVPAVKDEHRVPKDQRMVVTRTRDGGNTFETLDDGLPTPSWDLVFRHALDIDASGERLAMGSTTGNLWISENGGESWQRLSAHLPPIHQVAFV